jgi:predicted GNAT superfamily acetyltransferase
MSPNMKIIQVDTTPENKILKQLYSLNQDNVPNLGSLSSELELARLIKLSHICIYVLSADEIVGFMVCFRELSEYHSLNYKYFNEREDKFMYVDRIAIKGGHANKGLGSGLYEKLYKLSALEQLPICCEVNTKPINQVSLNFHYKNGFEPVGEYDFDDHSVAYLKKENHF